ncbi:N-acetylmuramoyl-L-alanine amidase [bacterium]|nr:N-acetylmuramoyl-L-alanine amidase [bacterium]
MLTVLLLLCLGTSPVWADRDDDSDYDVIPEVVQLPDGGGKSSGSSDKAKLKAQPSVKAPPAYTQKHKRRDVKSSPSGGFPWGNYDRSKNNQTKDDAKVKLKPSTQAPPPVKPSYGSGNKSGGDNKAGGSQERKSAVRGSSRNKIAGTRDYYGSGSASSNTKASIVIGAPKKLNFTAKNRSFPVSLRTTGIEDEYLTPVEDGGVKSIAQLFGLSSWQWDAGAKKLTLRKGASTLSLQEGQLDLPESLGGRHLEIGIRQVDGLYYFPLSIIEDILNVRVTVRPAQGKGWVEPLITNVYLDGSGRNLVLNVKATAPISYKTFRLNQPNRYVIDFYGGVLDTTNLRIDHPEMGDIRMGQFSLAPAVTRVVVPTTLNIKITPPGALSGQSFAFNLGLPKSDANVKFAQEKLLKYTISGSADGNKSNISLQFSGPVQYEWRRLTEGGNRFILDFKRVVFPENKLMRDVKGDFVNKVRISQYSSAPMPVARLVLDLKDSVSVKVGRGVGGNCLSIDIFNQVVDSSMTALRGEGSVTGVSSLSGGGRLICIDAGHGGSDSGCIHGASGLMEKEVTLDVSLKLAEILRARGWRVIMTREDDRDVTYAGSSNTEELRARAEMANQNNADIFMSIHCNAAQSTSAEGTSTHVYTHSDRALAKCLHPYLLNATGRYDRGIHQDRFYVLVHTVMPSVLIEMAFLTNGAEAKLLSTDEYRLRIATGLADGVCDYADKYLSK